MDQNISEWRRGSQEVAVKAFYHRAGTGSKTLEFVYANSATLRLVNGNGAGKSSMLQLFRQVYDILFTGGKNLLNFREASLEASCGGVNFTYK